MVSAEASQATVAGRKRLREDSEGVESPPKKIRQQEDVREGKEEEEEEDEEAMEPCTKFKFRTTAIRDLKVVWNALTKLPNIEFVFFTFEPKVVRFHAQPKQSPSIVSSYWNPLQFSDFYVEKPVTFAVSKARLEHMKGQLESTVEFVEFVNVGEDDETRGFVMRGEFLHKKTSTKSRFNLLVADRDTGGVLGLIDPSDFVYHLHFAVNSQVFKDSVGFMDTANGTLQIKVKDTLLTLSGINMDYAMAMENFFIELTSPVPEEVCVMLPKNYIDVIRKAVDISPSLEISFNTENLANDIASPVCFRFEFGERTQDQSYLEFVIMPNVDNS